MIRPGLLCAAALMLAGCLSLEPAYRRPAAPVPASFPTGPGYPAPGVESASVTGWRDFFSDPRLKSVIETALTQNRDLRAAVANVAIARAQYEVQHAQLYPTLDAEAGAIFARIPGGGVAGSPAAGHFNEHQFTAELAVSAYEVDLFGRIRSLSKAAFEQYLATAQARRAAQIALVAQVATAYVTLGADRTLLAIARDTLINGEASLRLTQARFHGGIASEVDVSQARTIVEQARFDGARLTTQCAQDEHALDLLVGAPVPEALLPRAVQDRITVLPGLPAGIRSAVLLGRPDVVQAEDVLKGANASIGAARAAFFPSITLTGTGGLSSPALSSLFAGPAATWTFAPQLILPIFDAGRNRANLAQAKATRSLDQAQYEKAIQTAFREVADALAQRGTIGAELAAQRALADAAAAGFHLATARYERGADTYLNVLIAQRTLYAAQQTLTAARLLQTTNLIALYQALGGGLS
ncbi:MAG TPA: efflux transporter outer membrane subunit [Caulobacteraceae bacterium]